MPQVRDSTPPPCLFAGRTFLDQAQAILDTAKTDLSRRIFSSFILLQWLVVRAVRSAAQFAPQVHPTGIEEHLGGVEGDVSAKVMKVLRSALVTPDLRYEYAFGRLHTMLIERELRRTEPDGSSALVTGRSHYEAAHAERIVAMEVAIAAGRAALRDIYLNLTWNQRNWGVLEDVLEGDEKEQASYILESGYTNSEEEALRLVREEDPQAYEAANRVYRARCDEIDAEAFDAGFWRRNEIHAIGTDWEIAFPED